MQAFDLSRETFNRIRDFLPQDKFYHSLVLKNKKIMTHNTEQEVLESCAFVLSLASRVSKCLPTETPKYLHLLAIVQATWHERNIDDIQKMLKVNKNQTETHREAVASVCAYKGIWTSLAQAQDFFGRILTQSELQTHGTH